MGGSFTVLSVDILALVADSVICTDEKGRIIFFNRAAEKSFGYSASEVIGQQLEVLLPERYRLNHTAQVRDFASLGGEADRSMGDEREVWGRRKNGEEFAAEATISRHLVDGKTILTVVNRDVTERKKLDEQREAIAAELDHRVRNVIAVASSLVSLSAKTATSVQGLRDSLQERLRAMASTQNFLRRGAGSSISLNDLLLAELAQYRNSDGANVILEGEPVSLTPSAVQPLALAVHELATNSAKYGALSVARGRVSITVEDKRERDNNLLLITWLETGGPTVTPPVRLGFGTTFIEQVIKRTFQAEVTVDYQPQGLVCRMSLPKEKVALFVDPKVR